MDKLRNKISFFLGKKIYNDYTDSPSSAAKPDSEPAVNENSDIEADRETAKLNDHLRVAGSPQNSPNLTRKPGVKKTNTMPPRAVSTESDDVDYLTPEVGICWIPHRTR